MKKIKILFPVLMLLVGVLFFASTTTEEKSNNEAIADLYADLEKMNTELATLKCAEEEEAVSMDPFLGEIIMFGGNFAPRGWALCDGQLLPISQYTALFSILGTTYGGDGRTTFALPDLRGRSAIHAGNGPGLSDRRLGSKGGQERVTLTINEMPSHNHVISNVPVTGTVDFDISKAGTQTPQTVTGGKNDGNVLPHTKVNIDLKANGSTMNQGGSQPHDNMAPYTTVNYIIALQGVFPSRS